MRLERLWGLENPAEGGTALPRPSSSSPNPEALKPHHTWEGLLYCAPRPHWRRAQDGRQVRGDDGRPRLGQAARLLADLPPPPGRGVEQTWQLHHPPLVRQLDLPAPGSSRSAAAGSPSLSVSPLRARQSGLHSPAPGRRGPTPGPHHHPALPSASAHFASATLPRTRGRPKHTKTDCTGSTPNRRG